MTHVDEDEERENRIAMEIVVDTYEAEEQSLGWYYYLGNMLHFPFTVTCIAQRSMSPLEPNDVVKVVGQPPEECGLTGFVARFAKISAMMFPRLTRSVVIRKYGESKKLPARSY